MSEFFHSKGVERGAAALLAVGLALGLTACNSLPPPNNETSLDIDDPDFLFRDDVLIKHIYTESGHRITQFKVAQGDSETLGYCDNGDLVEIVNPYNSGHGGSAISRSVGHAACTDNILTASDFDE